MNEPVFVEKFVTFNNYGDGWNILVWNSPPSEYKYYRLRIPVPKELLGEAVLAEVDEIEEKGK